MHCIVCSHGTVFPSNWLELSPSLEYNSRDLSISPVFKSLCLTLFSEVFTLYSFVFLLKIQITECFQYLIKILDLNSVLGVYKLILNFPSLHGRIG